MYIFVHTIKNNLNNTVCQQDTFAIKNFCLVFFLAFSLSLFYVMAGTETEQIEFADGLFARGMNEMAAAEYKRFLKDFPKSELVPKALFYLGHALRNIGEHKEAEAVFRDLFAKYPASEYRFRAGYTRAQIFTDLKQYSSAVYVLKNMLKENVPADIVPSVMYLLGDSLLRDGKVAEAVETFENLRKRYPSAPQSIYAALDLGRIYGGLDNLGSDEVKPDHAKAIALYKEIIAKPPTDRMGAEALFQLGRVLFSQNDFAASAETFNQLLTKYSSDIRIPEARLQAAWTLYYANLYSDAYKQATEALNNKQTVASFDEAQWLYLKANCERRLNNIQEAIVSYEQIINKFPSSPFATSARYEKVLCLYSLQNYKETVKEAEKIKEEKRIRSEILKIAAKSYEKLNDLDKAIQYYRLYLEEFPDDGFAPDAMFNLASNLKQKEMIAEALRWYGKFVEKYPTNSLAPIALSTCGICLEKAGQMSEAIKYWEKLYKDYPTSELSEEALYRKGAIELQLKKGKDAVETFDALLKKNPKSKYAADAYYWKGTFLAQTNDLKGASEMYKQALAASPRSDLMENIKLSLAHALLKTGNTNEAVTLYFQLVDKPAAHKFAPVLLKWLAEYGIENKLYDNAVKTAKLLLDKAENPQWKEIGHGLVGRAYYIMGKKKEAQEAYASAFTIKAGTPFAAEAALRLGEIELENKNGKTASDYFTEAARLAVGDEQLGIRARAYFGLGHSAKLFNDLDKAAKYFMSVAVLYDDDTIVPESLYEAASAFYQLHRDTDGDKAVEELKQRYPNSAWITKTSALKK